MRPSASAQTALELRLMNAEAALTISRQGGLPVFFSLPCAGVLFGAATETTLAHTWRPHPSAPVGDRNLTFPHRIHASVPPWRPALSSANATP